MITNHSANVLEKQRVEYFCVVFVLMHLFPQKPPSIEWRHLQHLFAFLLQIFLHSVVTNLNTSRWIHLQRWSAPNPRFRWNTRTWRTVNKQRQVSTGLLFIRTWLDFWVTQINGRLKKHFCPNVNVLLMNNRMKSQHWREMLVGKHSNIRLIGRNFEKNYLTRDSISAKIPSIVPFAFVASFFATVGTKTRFIQHSFTKPFRRRVHSS